eukprot:PhF_6_TR26676/c3_g1_i1/m.38790
MLWSPLQFTTWLIIITFLCFTSDGKVILQDGFGASGSLSKSTPIPITKPVEITTIPWPANFVKTKSSFLGALYDRNSIYLLPHAANERIQIDPKTRTATSITSWPAGFTKDNKTTFAGGAYTGNGAHILYPYESTHVIVFVPAYGQMQAEKAETYLQSNTAPIPIFRGGCLQGDFIVWMSPSAANRIVIVNLDNLLVPKSQTFMDWPNKKYPTSTMFSGAIHDGNDTWLVPGDLNYVVKVSSQGVMSTVTTWPIGFNFPAKGSAFSGGSFDGTNVWLVPSNADRVIGIDINTNTMEGVTAWPVGYTKEENAFSSGVYDGAALWLIPFAARI